MIPAITAMTELAPVTQHLQTAIDELRSVDIGQLSDAVICERIASLRRQIDQLEAIWSRTVAVAHRRGATSADGHLSTAAFLRHACHLTHGAARTRVDVAAAVEELPAVAAEFDAGVISHGHVAIITQALAALPAEIAANAEPVLLEAARHLDTGKLHQVARRIRHIANPGGQADADQRHYERRWLDLATTFDGLVAVNGLLDPEAGAALRTAIDAINQPVPGDERTPSQRRADALYELARGALDAGSLPDTGGERPHITVTIGLASLQGEPFTPPAELAWAGPISATAARRISCDATLTRIIIANSGLELADENGKTSQRDEPTRMRESPWWQALPPPLRAASLPLDIGRATRVIPPALRKALIIRDGCCAFPGCDRPPSWCDAHHIRHWADGGPTALANLVLLCRRHHRYVHEKRWQLTLNHEGTVTATPPTTPPPPKPAKEALSKIA